MIIKDRREFGGKLHPSILGFKCFICNSTLKSYPVVEWQGSLSGEEYEQLEYGSIYFHSACAGKLGKMLLDESIRSSKLGQRTK